MITLGVETSCDETSFSVVRNGREILSNAVTSSLREHRRFGGVVPEIASRVHLETGLACLEAALKKAKVGLKDVDLIAVTRGPGLMGSLLVGLAAAKTLSWTLDKPLVGVDHVIAHLYAGVMQDTELRFPFLGLVISGGHTLLVRVDSPADFKILGSTIDDAAGEAFDKVAKILGLRYPGGPEIDRLSRGQKTNRFHFTRPILSKDSLDFSFSGLKTAVYTTVERLKKTGGLTPSVKRQVATAFQESVCEVLVQKSLSAAASQGLRSLVVGGGVSANSRLRSLLTKAAKAEHVRVVFPDASLCQDNAAMIAGLGTALYKRGRRDSLALEAYADFLQHHQLAHKTMAYRRSKKQRNYGNPA